MSSLHTAEKLLFDVLSASKSIQEFTQNLDKESFQSSELIQSACERKFEIIGEALNRLKKYFPKEAEQIPEIEKIVGFRNIIAMVTTLLIRRSSGKPFNCTSQS
ncbi:MAG: hypothetical protein CVV42_11670 [Candidatus Riflebacteria bacterium HGW-Riflebacteria-2]|jgi:uncharacterized protein with HEPN domain|nr:MAG: hypothetical protein CVV42_11670 [Candidatus Riflebacteria bacterium HGW-Riflebacteria-2]